VRGINVNILLFGASGNIGNSIAQELLSRGHSVTGVTRTGTVEGISHPDLTVKAGDVTDSATVARLAEGHDAVGSAVGPRIGREDDHEVIVGATRGLIEGLRRSSVKRLVVLGGAGSLKVAAGRTLVESPGFPEMWRSNALAQIEALRLYRQVDDLGWTFISPAAHIEPGPRTGTFRVGGDELLTDGQGHSNISIADYATAFVDVLEQGSHLRQRISVAY
jgi:uncharacterized protein